MKVWTTNGRKIGILLGVFFVIALPQSVFASPADGAAARASVQFTGVMYDAPGSDSGREWIEVTNVGSSTVDLYGYKLFESGVNHGLTLVAGTTTLAAGESAIVAANTQKFLIDYPGYSGTLFKSSFSLTNTGESVALKDRLLAPVDGVSYTSVLGAAGDGNSLHLSNGSWVPGAPNPGSNAPTKAIVKAAPALAANAAIKTSAPHSKKTPNVSSFAHTVNAAPQDTTGTAAVSMAPLMQNIPSIWLYALGLVALIGIGVGAVLYAKPQSGIGKETLTPGGAVPLPETDMGAEEFELE